MEGKIKKVYSKKNPYKEREVRAGLNTALFVSKEKINAVITKEMGPISFHTLRDSFVEVYFADGDNVEHLVNLFVSGKLKFLKEPTRTKK